MVSTMLPNPARKALDTRRQRYYYDDLPVPVEHIAHDNHIMYGFTDRIEDNYGVAIREDGEYHSYVSTKYAKRRRMFTLAQIIGLSLILDEDGRDEGFIIPPSSYITNPKRQWAFNYAMMLTMPADSIRYCWADGWTPKKMAKKFMVPEDIMYQRIGMLGLY